MRCFFRHTRTWPTAGQPSGDEPTFFMTAVGLDQVADASKRDVYVHSMGRGNTDDNYVYVTRTLAQANAITGIITDTEAARSAAGVIAYKLAFAFSETLETLTMTNNSGLGPDMTDLTITMSARITPNDWDMVYGYVAAPAGVVLREVESELEERVSAGQILEGYHSSRIKKGRAGVEILSRAKQIVASAATYESAVANSNEFSGAVNFSILVGALAEKGEEYIDLIDASGAIASLFADELIDLNGIIQGGIVLVEIEEPEEVSGEDEPYTAARINFRGNFPRLRSDR